MLISGNRRGEDGLRREFRDVGFGGISSGLVFDGLTSQERSDLQFQYDLGDVMDKRSLSRERPVFPCDVCGKVFMEARYCRRHKEATHNNLPCRCVCGREYVYEKGLHRHQKFCSIFLNSNLQIL